MKPQPQYDIKCEIPQQYYALKMNQREKNSCELHWTITVSCLCLCFQLEANLIHFKWRPMSKSSNSLHWTWNDLLTSKWFGTSKLEVNLKCVSQTTTTIKKNEWRFSEQLHVDLFKLMVNFHNSIQLRFWEVRVNAKIGRILILILSLDPIVSDQIVLDWTEFLRCQQEILETIP